MMYELKQKVMEQFELKDCELSMGTSTDFEEAVRENSVTDIDCRGRY